MIHLLKKAAALGFLLFVVLWIVGVLRTLTLEYSPPPPAPLVSIAGDYDISSRGNSNFSANNLQQIGLIQTPLPLVLDNPEVEKIRIADNTARMSINSTNYVADEAKIRDAIKEFKAETFNERKNGLEPAGRWALEIGVAPEKFDALVDRLRSVGELASITVEQKDRTNEFRKLFSQRQSLKQYLESITKLRQGKNASLEDALKLEQKIQDIQKELDGLSVQFGELLGKESYYHVHVTLTEHQSGDRRDRSYSAMRRVGDGFVWAIGWWFGVVVLLGLIAGSWASVRVLRDKPI